VHIAKDDMRVSLANCRADVAIITNISMRREESTPKRSLSSLLPPSSNYEVQHAIHFVQEQYFVRPGQALPIATAELQKANELTTPCRIDPMRWMESKSRSTISVYSESASTTLESFRQKRHSWC
jgi:hypothetical protein